jgi:hypothetical protein
MSESIAAAQSAALKSTVQAEIVALTRSIKSTTAPETEEIRQKRAALVEQRDAEVLSLKKERREKRRAAAREARKSAAKHMDSKSLDELTALYNEKSAALRELRAELRAIAYARNLATLEDRAENLLKQFTPEEREELKRRLAKS